jgi:hypothetical protein
MTEKIKSADSRQAITNTSHKPHNGRNPHNHPPTKRRKLPIPVAANQPPCMVPLYFGGATLETNDIPIGLKNNSAMVRMKLVKTR